MPAPPRTPDLPDVEVPFPVRAPYSTAPALRPLGEAAHVVIDAAWPAARLRRLERLASDRDGVLVACTDDESGLRTAVEHAFRLLPGRPAPVRSSGGTDEGGWEALVRGWLLSCADDLVVLRRRDDDVVAELLAVAFPSGWSPRERRGASLLALHRPVADGDRLRRATPALAEALLTKGPFLQHVWGLDPSGRLDRDPSAPDAEGPSSPPPSQWWLRVERQTTYPLGDRALFTIRPYLVPLTSLAPDRRAVLADALASMSPEAVAYKGLTEVRDDVVGWLRT